MAARVAAEAGTASFPVGLVARADAVTAAEDRFFGGTAGLGFGGGGPHIRVGVIRRVAKGARDHLLDGVGGRPIATASSCARLTSISCSQGMSRPLKAGTAGGSGRGGRRRVSVLLGGMATGGDGREGGRGRQARPTGGAGGRRGRVRGRVGPARGRRAPATTPGLRRRRRGRRGSPPSPQRGLRRVARSARSAALRCARARWRAPAPACASGPSPRRRWTPSTRGRMGDGRFRDGFGSANPRDGTRVRACEGGRPRAPSGSHDGRARGRARRPDDHETRRRTVRHLERVT